MALPPLFEIRTNESSFVAEFEQGDVLVPTISMESILWNFEKAAGSRGHHQLALGSRTHHSTSP